MVTVTSLHTYPVKSCAGLSLTEAPVAARGLLLDRDLMIVADNGAFISQRQIPELALVVPSIAGPIDSVDTMTLSAPGMAPIAVPLRAEADVAERVDASVHGHPVVGERVGAEFDDWFTAFLPVYRENRRFRLLRVCPDQPRAIDEMYQLPEAANAIGFADADPILLTAEPSLARLNAEMEHPVGMDRFRPNIVVDGPELAAYEEDHWVELRIGAMTAFVVKACDRCAVPDVDQATAETGKAVRRALVTRRGTNAHDESNGGVFFGQNVNHVPAPGLTIRVGDPVAVVTRSATPNVRPRRGRRSLPRPAS